MAWEFPLSRRELRLQREQSLENTCFIKSMEIRPDNKALTIAAEKFKNIYDLTIFAVLMIYGTHFICAILDFNYLPNLCGFPNLLSALL